MGVCICFPRCFLWFWFVISVINFRKFLAIILWRISPVLFCSLLWGVPDPLLAIILSPQNMLILIFYIHVCKFEYVCAWVCLSQCFKNKRSLSSVFNAWRLAFLFFSSDLGVGSRHELAWVTQSTQQPLGFSSDSLPGGCGHYSTRGFLLFLPREKFSQALFSILHYFTLTFVLFLWDLIIPTPCPSCQLSDSSHVPLPTLHLLPWSIDTDVSYCVGDKGVALRWAQTSLGSKPGSWRCTSHKCSCFQEPWSS